MIEKVARQCILARKDYIPGKPIEEVQQELGITDIIKMASNENPMGASPKAIEAMIEEIRTNAFRYPVSLCTAMGEKLASYLGVRPSQLYIEDVYKRQPLLWALPPATPVLPPYRPLWRA